MLGTARPPREAVARRYAAARCFTFQPDRAMHDDGRLEAATGIRTRRSEAAAAAAPC